MTIREYIIKEIMTGCIYISENDRKIVTIKMYQMFFFLQKVKLHLYWFIEHNFQLFIFTIKCAICPSIRLGSHTKLLGQPYVDVIAGGSIEIGDNCEFLSKETSNRMGLNHRCMFSAIPAYPNTTARLVIGNNCGFSGIAIWAAREIIIGNNVRIGANTLIMDGDAHYDDPRTAPPAPIHIEDDVFIGANCVVKKGVTIGRGAVIGMNSVVTKDIPANCVAVGIPCKVIKQL